MILATALRRAAKRFPEQEGFVFKNKRLTFREAHDAGNRLGNGLNRLGFKKGDRIAILLPNSPEFIFSEFALAKTGLVKVPLYGRENLEEHVYKINDSGARGIIFSSEFGEIFNGMKKRIPEDIVVLEVGESPSSGISFYTVIGEASSEEPNVDITDNDLYQIRYTAGTTGKPKGAFHTQVAYFTSVYNLIIESEIQEGDKILLIHPMSHKTCWWMYAHHLKGAVCAIMDGWDAEEYFRLIVSEQITTLCAVPTIYTILVNDPRVKRADFRSVRTAHYGASPMPLETLKKGLRLFGQIFVQAYGSTESPMGITKLSKTEHVLEGPDQLTGRLLSCGREIMNAEIRVLDESDNDCPVNEIGEICIRGSHLMSGYWHQEEATKEAMRNGWFHSSDMGRFDEDGYLYVVDRKSDMIISGGYNIYPKEVEDVLYSHPAVLEAEVVAVPDEKWGETVKGIVVLKTGEKATSEELIEHCKKHIASYKKPTSIEFMKTELPKNPAGKILRRKLKEKYWGGKARLVG